MNKKKIYVSLAGAIVAGTAVAKVEYKGEATVNF